MGRGGNHSDKGRTRKSKGRMSYLRRVRTSGGGAPVEAKVDEFGQKYGDYEPAYGPRNSGKKFGGYGGRRKEFLKPGMKGFLCTTNFKENECVREAYNILNEYCENEDAKEGNGNAEADSASCSQETVTDDPGVAAEVQKVKSEEASEMKSQENLGAQASQSTGDSKKDDEDIDIDDALASELQNLRSEKIVKKFQRADTGVNNVVFISTTVDNPTELAHRIFEDVFAKKQTKSRFILRLLPIELTCNVSNIEEVKSKAKEIIEAHMKTGYISFRIVVNARLNGKFRKDEFIKSIADVVSQINPLSFVDLNNAQFTIVAEVLKNTLCLGIVKDFAKFKKYNLLEAGTPVKVDETPSEEPTAVSEPEKVTGEPGVEAGALLDELAADS